MDTTRKIADILSEKMWIARPLKTISEKRTDYRINIVTDDISKKSLFGGVATSLVLVTMLCVRNNWPLRIITRWNSCNIQDYYNFCDMYGMSAPEQVEGYSDYNINDQFVNYRLTVSDKDIFLATSWWSAKSILDSRVANKIMYIIQEEETFFYPFGDERFFCEQIMNDSRIDYIVNSKLLYDYLQNNGYDTLINNAVYFEPAFPEKLYYADTNSFCDKNDGKKRLFFYGRPKNPRNLFYFGIQCLDEAINRGIIDTEVWDIYMAGYDTEMIEFSNGYIAKSNGTMAWQEYAEFARNIDLAFCLMYTPHPSYPPFDMLCSGAVVLTNEFKNKNNLNYSDNMIMAKLNLDEMLIGFGKAILLACDYREREKNYRNNNIVRDWKESFKDIIIILEKRIKEGKYV